MYSIVLLTAMSAGPDVANPPRHHAPVVVVTTGCCGVVTVGCTGCSGSSCHGHKHHLFRPFHALAHHHASHHHKSCHGCCGYSCFGSCYGSCHGTAYSSCFGSCHGCYGTTWGPAVSYANPHVIYGSVTNPNPPAVMVIPVAPMAKPGSDGSPEDKPQSANLKFTLPADAKLFVDGKPTVGSGSERTFYTPALPRGQKFFYDVKAELMVEGKLVVEEKRVIVQAGASLTESFPKLVAAMSGGSTTASK